MASNRTGITERHSRRCATMNGKRRCTCSPRYRVQLRRDGVAASRTFATRAEAERWHRDAEKRIAFGHHLPGEETVGDALRRLDADLESGAVLSRGGLPLRAGVANGYRRSIARYLLPALDGRFARVKTSDLSQRHVVALRDELIARGLKGSTIANAVMPLRVMTRREIEATRMERDPLRGVTWPSKESAPAKWATADDAAMLLSVLPERDRVFLAIGFYAGLRSGEISALRWRDVDTFSDEPRITVRASFDQSARVVNAPKTKKGEREVPVIDQLAPIVDEYRAHLAAEEGAERIAPDALVFIGRDGANVGGSAVLARCKKVWQRHDLTDAAVLLHETRHTFASLAIASGIDIYHLSRIMGHSSIQITLDRYGHLYPDGLAEARRLLSQHLNEHTSRESVEN
jgi:integrase